MAYNEDVIKQVKELVSSQLGITVDKIQNSSKLVEDLGADSLDIVEMLMTLESEFGVTIPDEEASKMKTIEEVANVIDEKIKK